MVDGNSKDDLILEWHDIETSFTVHIAKEHCNAVYAYLFHKKIIADVWLYNLSLAPEILPWRIDKGKNAPYLNSKQYLWDSQLTPQNPLDQLSVFSAITPEGLFQAEIAIRSMKDRNHLTLLAVLRESEKIGWCRNAKEDGPLAKSLSNAIESGMYVSKGWS